MIARHRAVCLLAGLLCVSGTGCILVVDGGWRMSWGVGGVRTEPVTEQLAINTAGLEGLNVRTYNGAITFEPLGDGSSDAYVLVTKKGRGSSAEDAEAALAAIDVFVEPGDGGTQNIGWRWRDGRHLSWGATVSFEIHAPAALNLDAETHNGRVSLEGVIGNVRAVSHNGRMNVDSRGGELFVQTHNGRIEAAYVGDNVTLKSHNGRVIADLNGCASVQGTIVTHNGSVELVVGESTSTMLDCHTHHGSIRCNAPLSDTEHSRHRLTGTLGTGEGQQGQRTLSPLYRKDLHQEVVAPSSYFALPFDAVLRGMAFEQADRDATQPREIARREAFARATLVFVKGHIKNPMQ